MIRKRFLFFLVLISILILPAFVSAATLWDQPLSLVNTDAYFNQTFDPNHPTDSWLADDFVVNSTWDVSTIFVPGDFWYIRYYSNLLNATTLNWYIYEDNGGKPSGYPGDGVTVPVWSISLSPDDPQISLTRGTPFNLVSNVTLNLDTPISLDPGTYWLIVYPQLNWLTVGGHGRQFSDTANGYPAHYIMPDPAGEPTSLPEVWTSVLNIPWVDYESNPLAQDQKDLAFRIEGTIEDANIDVDPIIIIFPRTKIGESAPAQTVTLSNSGSSPLTINSATITGTAASSFNVDPGSTNGCVLPNQVLAPSAACTLAVTFTPKDAGRISASLSIASDALNANTTSVSLVGFAAEATLSVSEGTIGTVITISSAPSTSFGDKKGKVVIQNSFAKSNTKIAKNGWSTNEITASVTKAVESGIYDVVITLKDKTSITLPGAFTFKRPQVSPLTDSDGAPGESIEVSGKFFGSKKPKVYLEYTNANDVDKKKNCTVKTFTWNPTTGESSLVFTVPKGLESGRAYPLRVETKKVGTSLDVINFTIN